MSCIILRLSWLVALQPKNLFLACIPVVRRQEGRGGVALSSWTRNGDVFTRGVRWLGSVEQLEQLHGPLQQSYPSKHELAIHRF